MASTHKFFGAALVALIAVAPLAGPAAAQGPGPQNRWDWSGGRDDDRRAYTLTGAGARMLIPELRDSRRGQAFVLRNFDFNRDSRISPREAAAANEAFLAEAGAERDRFDWDRRAGPGPGMRPGPGPGMDRPGEMRPGERFRRGDRQWNRQGMRDYRMRQGRYGATFSLSDVLFQTGSSTLLPAAMARLEPLADYLDANPAVRVRLDGFTDSVGSYTSNLRLSHNRAKAVAAALTAMGVSPNRLEFYGNGENTPVASNATAAGRQLNRRVEVTLLGQRADSFR